LKRSANTARREWVGTLKSDTVAIVLSSYSTILLMPLI
jgi:hypothetical protein